MWSLYSKKEGDSGIGTGLFSYSGEKLAPLQFSNGKTQEDVVKEVLTEIQKGKKIIFIKGVCGSGKSAMALNLAKHFSKASIVVPIKSLQEQYERDYMQHKFVLKDNGKLLKIAVIKGRNNFPCLYGGERADDPEIPCIIELKEKNMSQILEYIEENPLTEKSDFSELSDVRRANVAAACPYWSPIMPSDVNPKGLGDVEKKKYMAVCGKEYAIYKRKRGCKYYDQYDAYAEADVLIFNSMKYLLETDMGRKPKTDIEIIDECDEFLDNFANERTLNISRLHSALSSLTILEADQKNVVRDMLRTLNDILYAPASEDTRKIRETPIQGLIDSILENPNLAEEEETNYYHTAVEIARAFEPIFDDTYVSVIKLKKSADKQAGLFDRSFASEDTVMVEFVSINLAQKFKELVEKNSVMVLMSGTVHSAPVLRDIFGLENFSIVEAETKNPGLVKKCRTGLERNCSFANFSSETISRKMYLKIMDVCMANAKNPTLVHVSAFKDLPTDEENKEYKFENLITKERLLDAQSRGNEQVDNFHAGRQKVLFTTKCSRGVDFPGDKCNSIVITRYPYPNVQGTFWKILKKEQPQKFLEFYLDKARRELIQKVARGVRFKGDTVELWSPDIRVINENFD